MSRTSVAAALVMLVVASPLAVGAGMLSANVLVNPDFDTYVVASVGDEGRFALDRCAGIGHQVWDPFYSPWADWGLGAAKDPAAAAQDPATPAAATGYPVAHAQRVAADPHYAHRCDPRYRDTAQLNAWEKTHDVGFGWSNDPGTKFYDFDGDGDVEAVIPQRHVTHTHNLWQSVATPQQAMSADFRSFEWTLESGVVPRTANVQIGLSLSPGFDANPWVGAFWDGAVMFRAAAMTPDEAGRVRLDPALQGEIICPAYPPCTRFKAAFAAADEAGKRELLGQARIVQLSFWSFSGGVGPVVLDDIAFVGQKTAAEGFVAGRT